MHLVVNNEVDQSVGTQAQGPLLLAGSATIVC